MSSDTEDPRLPDQASEKFDVISGKPRISYSRDFLLSLSSLEICKKLPSGFDESLLSEFEDASQSIPDRPRIPGSTPLQGFRRNEYGSSPPPRRDFGNYPRSTYGKWDTRSSGRNDRDSDSQSDKDSDSGKRYTHPSRRSWQTTEHDGLLGSGSFPRPSGYSGGVPAPKVQASEPNQLGKSVEPYQPPRPYKALPHSRRDTDAFNDETFGSSESTSEDRAEEERRRRVAFEMMRKEQQKEKQQEKPKVDQDKLKAGGNLDLFDVLEESSNKKRSIKSNESGVSAAIPISSNDNEKSSFGSGSPATRPLIPPGFKHNVPDKTSGLKSLMHLPSSEVEKLETRESLIENEAQTVQNDNHEGLGRRLSQKIGLVDRQPSENTQHASIQDIGGNLGFHTGLNVPVRKLSVEDELHHASIHKSSHGTLNDQNIAVVNSALLEDKSVGDSNRSHSTSMLEKIFGGTLSSNEAGFGSAEHKVNEPDDTWRTESVRSSKFAQWFSEEESKVPDDATVERQDNLLSLIASGDRVRHQVPDNELADNGAQDNLYRNLEYSKNITSGLSSVSGGISNQLNENTKGAVPAPLTLEDVEQSILSAYSVKTTEMPPQLKDRSGVGVKLEGPSVKVGGTASLDLLSMLQKGKDHTDTSPSHGVSTKLADKSLISQENSMLMAINEPRGDENTASNPNSDKSLILETLFGSAFMSQLKSAEAPVSIQRGGSGSARDGFPLQFTDNGTSPIINQIGLGKPSHEYSVLSSENRHQTNSSGIGNWLGFDDHQSDMSSKKHHTVIGFDAQPSKEENIFPVSDPRYRRMSSNIPGGNLSRNVEISSDVSVDITNKLAALSAAVEDERVRAGSESLSFGRGPFEQMDSGIPFRNLQIPPSSQFQQLPQVAQVRPPFHQMQAQTQMNFMGPEPMFNHQFPSNDVGPFHHPNMGAAGYDVSPFHPMLNQMQVRNHSPHIIPEFPRSGPSSRHGNEINQMQGFPTGPRQPQPNRGLPIPGPNINPGNTPPEAFQRLLDMELRANSTQRNPFAPDRGMYGHEVDMGFPFR